MASMQFYRPEEEIYYEEYRSHAQTPPAYGAEYQMGAHGHNQGQHMGFRGQHGHNEGPHMGYGQHLPHSGQVHDPHMHMAGPGMLMQTPGYQMGNHYGSMEHHQQGHGYEMGPGHLGQVFGSHAKHQEHDGMAYHGKGEKKIKDKKNKKKEKKKKKNKKDDSSSDSD